MVVLFSFSQDAPSKNVKGAHVKQRNPIPEDGVVRVWRERRRASVVCVVTGLVQAELAAVAADLKKRCGTGGTAKDGKVEVQGDHRDAIVAYFTGLGRRVKKAGG
ncbi:MAG: stress response translation initiation inhibitor YciH [Candidatus Eremiobacteraeota bacterium]|nr:stress response translation initiation inhibitor YciH [Candidatus Eremiobacteraeota bacterium]